MYKSTDRSYMVEEQWDIWRVHFDQCEDKLPYEKLIFLYPHPYGKMEKFDTGYTYKSEALAIAGKLQVIYKGKYSFEVHRSPYRDVYVANTLEEGMGRYEKEAQEQRVINFIKTELGIPVTENQEDDEEYMEEEYEEPVRDTIEAHSTTDYNWYEIPDLWDKHTKQPPRTQYIDTYEDDYRGVEE
jgi:hypothetical protein